MVSLPHHAALVMLGDIRVAISPSTHTYMERKDMIMETIQGNVEPFTNELELLFSLELHYQGPIELAPMGDKVGTLVGGGDGTLTVPRRGGTGRWTSSDPAGEAPFCHV